jgi:hypothetical protein
MKSVSGADEAAYSLSETGPVTSVSFCERYVKPILRAGGGV